MTKRKPVEPFYAAAVVFLLYALIFPLYAPLHYAIAAAAAAAVFAVALLLCRGGAVGQSEKKAEKAAEEKTTGDPELDKMLKNGRLAIAEMKRLDGNIADEEISADIVRLEQVSEKIFDQVRQDPRKLPQIRKFMDYYLPTTLKLLNAYDRAAGTGVSGENINATLHKVEGMMKTIVSAFEKQLDALFGSEALDISTDITVLENMMAREGLTENPLKAESVPKEDGDIKLEL
ncbi:5-bromo-4-chloroindolyl phosphate hydrolysis family protein [Oscillibacter sp. MSJ-2]|uniref:5-bromo-4-chloroindolyl phosphate hydrolysis family protein n=1 Tax=Dysosmobacter acutus TaxID=2841504 RepID=A0ABS6FDG3_9FIRM|nr:5-bromo-4-chloroindolyl phosphate hydrolysis family protein [Dysosmobacter acutus]MBU5628100.1 5-bromo-4-chloroindolyl phosphate hydrolysis family protein [Dysosmobacter acutus]